MKTVFEWEWRHYRRGAGQSGLTWEAPHGSADFDLPVRPGEVRIFADANRPFVALILEANGLLGYRIVPVSPFTVPASDREYATGGRVYQLWNTCRAAKSLTERSWFVARVDETELETIRSAISSARPGRLTDGDSPRARYEREFLVAGGLLAIRPRMASERGQAPRFRWGQALRFRWGQTLRFWGVETVKIAASVFVCLGAFYFLMGEGRDRLRAWRERGYAVEVTEEEAIELSEMALVESPEITQIATDDHIFDDFSPERLKSINTVARPGGQAPMEVGARLTGWGQAPGFRWGQSLKEEVRQVAAVRFRPIRLPNAEAFVNPYEMPLSVLDMSPDQPLATLEGGQTPAQAGGQTPDGDGDSPFPAVGCRLTECPWNPQALLVNVRADGVAAALVEVFFDKALVKGYRLVSGGETRPLDAYYEVVLRLGDRPPIPVGDRPSFVQVTVRAPIPGGERRVRLMPECVSLDTLGVVPLPPSSESGRPDLSSPADVPVDVRLEGPVPERRGSVL